MDDSPGLLITLKAWFKTHIVLAGKAADSPARLGLGMFFIFALVLIVYSPILPGNFLMDDHRLIYEDNPLTNGELSPLNIWFQTDFTLSTFGLWLQWLAWGEHPGCYHAINMALHTLSAVLLWRLLAQLKIPGAWLAAALFAVHPVCVNSVARIAEIKNTLSLPFFILSFWLYLRYENISQQTVGQKPMVSRRWRTPVALWYGFSLIAFVLALLSKTSTVMLPVVLLGCALWQRGRITRQDILQTSPFFILSLAFGLMSVWFQKHQALTSIGATLPPESILEKLAIAGLDIWFYLGKALLPMNLNIVYSRWMFDPTALASLLPVLILCGVFAICWRSRRSWGRHVLFGLGCFIIALFPALGFFDSQFLTRWQVSDHLQYLPLIAPLALAVAGMFSLSSARIIIFAGIILLLTLSTMTFQRAQLFASEEILMRESMAKNPEAWFAKDSIGIILAKRQEFFEAAKYFKSALESNPNNDLDKADAHAFFGQILVQQNKFNEAETHFLAAIKIVPNAPEAHNRLAIVLSRQGRNREAVDHFKTSLCLKPDIETRLKLAGLLYQTGDSRRAADQFRKILAVKPNLPESRNNLAWILATSADASVRNGTEAVLHAEQACNLTSFKQTGMVSTLAAAYAEAGRFPEAVTTAESAVNLANARGEPHLADINNQLLPLYRAGKPYHEQPLAYSP